MAWTDVNLDNLRCFTGQASFDVWLGHQQSSSNVSKASTTCLHACTSSLPLTDINTITSCVTQAVGQHPACGCPYDENLHQKSQNACYGFSHCDMGTCTCRVACACYGGPIATIRDDRKMVLVSGGITQPLVKIYSSAGTQMAVFIWDKGRIEAMGWTNTEDLIIVEQTGEVCTCLQAFPQHHLADVISRYTAACTPVADSHANTDVLHVDAYFCLLSTLKTTISS